MLAKRFVAATATVVTTATALIWGAQSAAAAPAGGLDPAGSYCAMYLPTGAHACVDTLSMMPTARAAVLPTASTSLLPNASVHIATIWDNASYDSAKGSYEFYTSADCTSSKTDSNWQNQDLSGIGWANRISSFQSFGNCQTRLFTTTNFGGSTYPTSGYIANSSNVGTTMNDNAESIKWT